MRLQYTKEFLLSFAEKQECKRLPSDLDPALRRDSPSPDIVDGGSKFGSRRDHELPEWRRPSANGGGLLSQRRKNFDEESGSHPRGTNWESRNSSTRPGPQSKWDRDREKSSSGSQWEGSEQDAASRPRFGWNNSEHDGLLGSGGGLRGAYPGGRGSDRYNAGGRGTRNSESRFNKSSGGSRDSSSIDGETFGEKASTENRAEEERKRREEFEAMRREQQRLKELKGKQKEDNGNKENNENKENDAADSVSDSKQDTSTRVSVPSIPRPLVPPGFSHRSNVKKEEQINEEQTNKQGTVDPNAIACSVSEGEVSELAGLFSKTTIGATPLPLEKADTKTSKFAHLFTVEDENPMLSLFSSSGNSPRSPVSTMSEMRKPASEVSPMLPMPVGPLLEDIERTLGGEAEKAGNVVPLSQRLGKPVLTCEDVEQSFLAEAKVEVSTTEWIQEGSSWKQEAVPDNNASRHLLSLLQKPSSRTDNERVARVEEQAFRDQDSVDRGGSDNGIATLESLFGMSFMKELRSTDAPLSAKVASDPHLKGVHVAPGVVEFQTAPSASSPEGHQPWRQREHAPSHMMSLEELEKSFLDNDTTPRLRQAENGDASRLPNQPPRHTGGNMFDTGAESSGNRSQQEDLDNGVLSDFLKFKRAMNHRNKVNDSVMGLVDGMTESQLPDAIQATSGGVNVSTPAALFRSHSPPSISQRANSLQQLHQLQQVLASQGVSKPTKQFQHNVVMGNGELNAFPDGRYGRVTHARPPFPRQQQQAMYEQIHGHFAAPQGFPPQVKRSPSYFPSNGSNQPVHMVHGPGGMPPMSYGHPPPPFGPGFVGPFAPPNEVFLAGGEHAAAVSMDNTNSNNNNSGNNNRWSGGRDHVGVPGVYQQPMYGVNKLGFP